MKYGVIFFKDTQNIGDDIQTYAALRYLPQIDYVIERERLSTFVPKNNELVSVIMNGWYMHNPMSFPPSPFINPLLISMHLTIYLQNGIPSYLTESTIEFLKNNGPVGIRDHTIEKVLTKVGIKSYYSSCLTTTIKPFDNIEKKEQITMVDIDKEVVKTIKKLTKKTVKEVTHILDIEKNSSLSFEKRMENVEELLKEYQRSSLVITTRLHCALPCLALGVPVILIYDDKVLDIKNRLGDYLEYLNYMSIGEALNLTSLEPEKYILNNQQKFSRKQKELIKKCEDFISNSKNKKLNQKIDLIDMYKKIIDNNEKILVREVENAKEHLNKYYGEFIDKMLADIAFNNEKEYNALALKYRVSEAEKNYCYENIQRLSGELNRIRQSRAWKIYQKLKKFKKLMFWRKK